MLVRLHKHQLDRFRRIARDSPNEIIAYLFGKKRRGHCIEVESFFYPVLEESTPASLAVSASEYSAVHDEAQYLGLKVLGSIHSHPNYLPIMSDVDLIGHISDGDLVSGIVEVRKRRTRVAFWTHDSPLTCDLEYY